MKEEVLFWKKAKRLLKKGYGANCKTRDIDDFPDIKEFKNARGRCPGCRAKEVIELIDDDIDILNEKERDNHLSDYLEAQKEKDPRWRNISCDTASKKMKCAYALAELYHAVSNAIHILNGATNPYHFELLTYHINRLEKELEKLET